MLWFGDTGKFPDLFQICIVSDQWGALATFFHNVNVDLTVYTLKRVPYIIENQCELHSTYKTVHVHAFTMKYKWYTPLSTYTALWHHQMETFSALIMIYQFIKRQTTMFSVSGAVHIKCFTGHLCREFTCLLSLDKRPSKQSWGWWFETPSRSLWRHCNGRARFWLMLYCHIQF